MNNITTSSLVLLLGALYLWRIISREKKIGKEILSMFILTPTLFYCLFFFSLQPTNPIPVAPQATSEEATSSPTSAADPQNPMEEKAFTLSNTEVPKINIQATGGPQINILYPANGQIFSADTATIVVKAQISDRTDPNPIVSGVGAFALQPGYNAIVVAAVNKDGHASSRYVIVKRQP